MSDAANNGFKNGTEDLDLLPSAADTHNAAENRNIQDNNDFKDGTGDAHNTADDPDIQDLVDRILRQFSNEKPLGVDTFPDGVMPHGTVMGFCEKKYGVIAADSLLTYQHENTSHTCDTAMKVVQVAPRIGLVGLGSERVFSEVQKRVEDFDPIDELASTMKDVVDSLVHMITDSVEETKNLNLETIDLKVFYIVLGKMNEGFEMYTVSNCDDSGRVVAKRAETRIANGGSGHKLLSSYQNEKPPDTFVTEGEVVTYCFECMKHAVLEDKEHSGGDINMVLITNDEYRPYVFCKSYVSGYSLAPRRST